jgi:hypothetical protein
VKTNPAPPADARLLAVFYPGSFYRSQIVAIIEQFGVIPDLRYENNSSVPNAN